MSDSDQIEFPSNRVVLLGASNLIRSISPVFEYSRAFWGSPLDLITTAAHGRSYSRGSSNVLWRSLPGILACEIWSALKNRPRARTATLLTDIGNDLLFGATVDQIKGWIGECLEKVSNFSENIMVSELPIESIEKVGATRFKMMRTMLFPSSSLRYDDAMERSFRLNDEVVRLAKKFNATIVRPRAEWFGIDPIHIRRSAMSRAWREILAPWIDNDASIKTLENKYKSSITRWARLRFQRPFERRMFGIVQRKTQPAVRLRDGSCVSYY